MEIEECIIKMKEIYNNLLEFFDASCNYDVEYRSLVDTIEEQDIVKNKKEVEILFQLISKIGDNYHMTSDFVVKIEMILDYIIKEKKATLPDFTIFRIFESNKRIIFHLFDKRIIKPDEFILKSLIEKKCFKEFKDYHFLYPTLKPFIEKEEQKLIEDEISYKYNETIESFEEKCRIGENDSYVCSLIRNDSIEEFITYVNKKNMSLLTEIQPSIFETNPFLIGKQPTLIEYAAFFGSIQIIQFLKYNKVKITETMWCFAIHSNNAELIHFLEENNDNKSDNLYMIILKESIKCHHNDIADYIKDNLISNINENSFKLCILESSNYHFPIDVDFLISHSKIEKGINMSNLCYSLNSITIPSSVKSIGDHAFDGCFNLSVISIHSKISLFGIGVFQGIKSLEIKGDIDTIPDKLFENNSLLKQIKLPSSITLIGNYSFSGCHSLVEIQIPSSVNSIGNCCFERCSSLIEIVIPPSVTSILRDTFNSCSSLKKVVIPSSVSSIEFRAFEGCSSLIEISLPSSLTSIGMHAFDSCCSLKQIVIPPSITTIQHDTFNGCSSLEKVTIPSSVSSIGSRAFEGCSSLIEISLPSSLTSIGMHAFDGCSSLKLISIPSSVTKIGDYAFCYCTSLTTISIPSSVESIGIHSFNGCSSLSDILLGSQKAIFNHSIFPEGAKIALINK